MKSKIYLLLFTAIVLLGTKPLKAQDRAGQTMLSLGVGYSLFSTEYVTGYSSLQSNFSVPELAATVDYFVINMYSVGLNVAYQSASGTYNNYYGNPGFSYKESVSRVNVNVRSIVHFTKHMNPDFYGGIRLGYAYYNYTYSGSPYYPYYNNEQPLTQPTIQAFLGVRAIITPVFSTYLEVGTGTPYIAEMGFSFSLGGKSAPETPVANPTGPGGPPPYVH